MVLDVSQLSGEEGGQYIPMQAIAGVWRKGHPDIRPPDKSPLDTASKTAGHNRMYMLLLTNRTLCLGVMNDIDD